VVVEVILAVEVVTVAVEVVTAVVGAAMVVAVAREKTKRHINYSVFFSSGVKILMIRNIRDSPSQYWDSMRRCATFQILLNYTRINYFKSISFSQINCHIELIFFLSSLMLPFTRSKMFERSRARKLKHFS